MNTTSQTVTAGEITALVEKAKLHDTDAMAELICRFTPIFKKYAHYLKYDGAESDLIIQFMELIYKFPEDIIAYLNDGKTVTYISQSIRNKSIDLHLKGLRQPECQAFPEGYSPYDNHQYFSMIYFNEIIKELTPRQQFVLKCKFKYEMTVVEIGHALKITRQAVNRLYSRAIDELRKEFKK